MGRGDCVQDLAPENPLHRAGLAGAAGTAGGTRWLGQSGNSVKAELKLWPQTSPGSEVSLSNWLCTHS